MKPTSFRITEIVIEGFPDSPKEIFERYSGLKITAEVDSSETFTSSRLIDLTKMKTDYYVSFASISYCCSMAKDYGFVITDEWIADLYERFFSGRQEAPIRAYITNRDLDDNEKKSFPNSL